jgi:DMSO/TMAO reductase YedYZ heme-binding membrane subunit
VNGLLWYSTRAAGEVALLFLTVVVAFGVMSAVRVGGRRIPRFVVAGMHRNLTLVGLGFLVVHIGTAVLDTYAPIGLADAVLPFTSAYRPIWLGLGTLAFDTLLVLTVTSLLRTRIGLRRWKALHWTAYGCWVTALVHALGTGTDTRASAFLILAGFCCALTLALVGWRLAAGGPGHQGARVGAGLAALLVTVLIAAWTVRGPLEPGWAKRSGTPASLLPGSTTGAGG